MKRGDKVELVSGGPPMVVMYPQVARRRTFIGYPMAGERGAGVMWFDMTGKLCTDEIPEDLLVLMP